uniref:Ubiquitin-like domain-containing protein n=1 Tax=Acrobeloides nanus TaxID=290746 RepID=A0A914EJK7_9BILA
MEITLIIDLQDHTGSSHKKTSLKLSSETTVEQLKGEIKSLFLIDKQHQELYFKGDQILSLNSTLQRIGLKDENTIFVAGFKCKITNDGANFGTFYTPDLREIFVYKLLELIKVGSEVHFIPNVLESTTGLYIATREVSGFKEAKNVTIDEDNNIQLELLQNLLFLRDLRSNRSNYGLDRDGQLAIVDIQVENHKGSKQSEMKSLIKTRRSQEVCKERISVWCLLTNINKADAAITSTKNFLNNRIRIMETHEKTYEKYRKKIKSNVEFLNTQFSD